MKKYHLIFTLIVFCLIGQNIYSQSNYKALLVGIWDYPDPSPGKLPNNFENDSNDLKQYLIDYQGWSGSNIEVKINGDANASNILQYISSMPNTRGVTELFTYGGHGVNSEDHKGLQTVPIQNSVCSKLAFIN